MELFQGTGVALVTPFTKSGDVDYKALENLIEYQIEGGVDAIITLGTTGEASTLTAEEKAEVIKFSKKIINGRTQWIIGTGGNCTASAIKNTQFAEEVGADAVLVVTPYYNKCTQNGLVEYYGAIRSATKLPIISYNVPGRTGVNILPSTFAKAVKLGYVNAIKEASGNISQISEVARLIEEELDNKAVLYSGDDGITLPVMAVGGKGVISVLANPAPKAMKALTDACLNGNWEKARKLQLALNPFVSALFCEVNPIPVKASCAMLGLCENVMRSPLTTLEEANYDKLKSALDKAMSIQL